jgi:LacI family transcriptional regulator, repressor for deo operon, udp, cdd, tsx, nupC, and nupG
MAVKMEDLARTAGVSRSTISRALAGSSRVKPETRARIQRLAADMGYLPNSVARSLTTKRTYNLGVLLLDITEAFVSELVRDMESAARESGYQLLLAHCGYEVQQIRISFDILLQRQVDAVIIADRVITDIYLPPLQDFEVPLVVMNVRDLPYSVVVDNEGSARAGVEHLLDLGHERIAYIGSPRARVESAERQAGYERALLSRGISPDLELIVTPTDWRAAEAGRQGVDILRGLSRPPTAVFCFNDLTALGAMAEISAVGLNVPRDISVLGFDDNLLAPYMVPALTTMAQPKALLAKLAVGNALRALAGQPPQPRDALPCRLVVRASTAAPSTKA